MWILDLGFWIAPSYMIADWLGNGAAAPFCSLFIA